MSLQRRDFLRASVALGLTPGVFRTLAAAPAGTSSWAPYEDAIVIDFLASPGYSNYPEKPPLDDVMVSNAVESGITAVNKTVSSGDFAATASRIAGWLATIDRFPDVFRQVRSVEQLRAAKRERRVGLVFGFQNTTPYEGDLDAVGVFDDFGVRVVQLTYNIRNLVGDGCLEPGNAGLSTYGRAVVERLNELGTLIDLSHCGKRTTAEGIRASTAPVAITHSGCNAVAPHPRSKDDEDLRAMADGGGVIGIYLMPFLSPGRVSTESDVVAHIEHALDVCGEDHVGIGSDLSITPIDGSDEYWAKHREFVAERIARGIAAPAEDPDVLFMVPDLNSHRRMDLIAAALDGRGHPDRVIEKVIGGNWLRLCDEVWH